MMRKRDGISSVQIGNKAVLQQDAQIERREAMQRRPCSNRDLMMCRDLSSESVEVSTK